jgi:hypothetical protein
MIYRHCSFYHRTDETLGLSQQIINLEVNGFQLGHPNDKVVYRLTKDGDRIESSLDDIGEYFDRNRIVDFVMWADAESQLYVQFCELGDQVCCSEFEFTALLGSVGLDLLQRMVLGMFTQASYSGLAIAMLVDAHGHTEDFDWDQFFLTRRELPIELPDYLAVRSTEADLLRGRFEGFEPHIGFWSYRRDDWKLPPADQLA